MVFPTSSAALRAFVVALILLLPLMGVSPVFAAAETGDLTGSGAAPGSLPVPGPSNTPTSQEGCIPAEPGSAQVCDSIASDASVVLNSVETTNGETGNWTLIHPQLGNSSESTGNQVIPAEGPHDGTWVVVFEPGPPLGESNSNIDLKASFTTADGNGELNAASLPYGVVLGSGNQPVVWVINLHKEATVGCLPEVNECQGADLDQAGEGRFFLPGEPGMFGPKKNLPPELNCSGASGIDGWENWINQIVWDPDCSDNSLVDQLVAGCDPFDPTSNPSNPDNCNEPPTDGDLERWTMGYVPDSMNCSDSETPTNWANQVIWGPDCSDNPLVDQLVAGCNPFNPASNPGFPDNCLPEPDTDEPHDWVNQTTDWVSGQALWLVLTTLPPWLVLILFRMLPDAP